MCFDFVYNFCLKYLSFWGEFSQLLPHISIGPCKVSETWNDKTAYVKHIIFYCVWNYMFRSLYDHHQAFLRIKSINAGYMLGSQHVASIYWLYSQKGLMMVTQGPKHIVSHTIKYDVFDVSWFIILILNINTSGFLQSNIWNLNIHDYEFRKILK